LIDDRVTNLKIIADLLSSKHVLARIEKWNGIGHPTPDCRYFFFVKAKLCHLSTPENAPSDWTRTTGRKHSVRVMLR
jgi:hypothetical protein